MSDVDDFIRVDVPPSGPGCVDCEKIGSWWLHLRRCAFCGHVGCCDDSLHKHGTTHAHTSGHRVIQSFEPGEDWFWDFGTETVFDGPVLAPPRSHPRSQTTPGPAERVPADWEEQLAGNA
ncbi:UBP-type zinc finger domain-containing protein [Microbacterium phyllosphaerae]|uniref:UBP-type zinc finger domain-containing protein n=1 Tax=Microbacterium phyllosphaerae TaxID=124798 RepID=UPI003D64763C